MSSQENIYEQFNKTLNTHDKRLQKSFARTDKYFTNMPPKILTIEKKLDKFREEKIRHEITAKQMKEQDDLIEWELRQEMRKKEIEKLRANNTYVKQVDKRIYENWKKTEDIKQQRIEDEQKFQAFMTGKILNRLESEYKLEQKETEEGFEYFYQNCQRQGIELNHNPDEEQKEVKKAKFSLPATMMKIKERTKYNAQARQARTQRRNKMMVDLEAEQIKVEIEKQQTDFLEKVFNSCQNYNKDGWETVNQNMKYEITKENRLAKSTQQNQDLLDYFEKQNEISKQKEEENKQKRIEENKAMKLKYMEINLERKIKSRAKHTKQQEEVLNTILDLVEVCYQEQIRTKSLQISQPTWDNYMERFINGQNFTDEKVFKIFEEKKKPTDEESLKKLDKIEERNKILQEKEFSEFYSAQFNWIPVHEYQDEDKQFLNRPFNNNALGDFLCGIVDKINPKQEIKQKPEDLPSYLPLTMSIVGKPFSGKKYMANMLKQKYNFELIDYQQIIKEAILIAFPPEEDEADKKKKAKKDAKKQQEEEKPENPELKQLGIELNEYVSKDEQIPDQLIIKAITIKVRELFPKLDTKQLIEQVQQQEELEQKRLEDILKQKEDIAKKGAKKAGKDTKKKGKDIPVEEEEVIPQKTPEELLKERQEEQKVFSYSAGYALLNFPTNLTQAKLLEESLTGYVPDYDRLNQQAEEKKAQISELVAPSEQIQDSKLISPGIQLYFQINTPTEECIRRANGRRIDPQTDIIYHIEDNPPTDQKILDRLKELDSEQQKIEEFQQKYQENSENLLDFISQFGEEGVYQSLNLVDTQNQNIYELYTQFDDKIQQVLKYKKQKFEEIKEKFEKEEQIRIQKEQEEELKKQKEQEEAAEAEIQKKEKEDIKSGQPSQQKLGDQKEQKSKGNSRPLTEQSQKSQKSQKDLENSQKTNTQQENTKQSEQNQEEKTQQAVEEIEQPEEKQQVKITNPIDVLDQTILNTLLKQWDDIQQTYQKDVKNILLNLFQHREVVSSRSQNVQNRFLQIIQKKDDKQQKIHAFQANYNSFYDENSEMLRFSNAKDELYKHLDELYEGLWDNIENKKNLAQEDRNNIVCSGWIESEQQTLMGYFIRLYQTEINKLHEIVDIFYYILDSMEKRQINEVQEHVILEPFVKENPPIEDIEKGSYPKVELLHNHFLEKIDNIHDLIQEIRIKFQKKRMGRAYNKIVSQKDTPEYQLIYQTYQNIMKYEKANCKIRGLILKNNLISRIKEIRNLGQSLYNKMDDWIIFGLKAENDVTYSAIQTIKNAIKNQQKSQVGQVIVQDISDTYQPLQGYTIVLKQIQPQEIQQDNRFTIQQLNLIFEEIKTLQDANHMINGEPFYNFFVRRKNYIDCKSQIPIKIQNLSNIQVKQMLFRLDCLQKKESIYQITDFLNSIQKNSSQQSRLNNNESQILIQKQFENINFTFQSIMTVLCLLSSNIPNSDNLEEYAQNFQDFIQYQQQQDNMISFVDFIEIPAWFDEYECDNNLYDGYIINRSRFIKTILFDTYCSKDDEIDYVQYLESLKQFQDLEIGKFNEIVFGLESEQQQ